MRKIDSVKNYVNQFERKKKLKQKRNRKSKKITK